MKKLLSAFCIVLIVIGCKSEQKLSVGRWSGYLTPMNHPEMQAPISYLVDYINNELQISIIGPGNSIIPANNTFLTTDTLYFSFYEPEEQLRLQCALGRSEEISYSGKCIDDSGIRAIFTMNEPR